VFNLCGMRARFRWAWGQTIETGPHKLTRALSGTDAFSIGSLRGVKVMDKKDIFISSEHIQIYDDKSNRTSFGDFYESERVSLERILPNCMSVTDIGCLNGDTLKAISDFKSIKGCGIDFDQEALSIAKVNYPEFEFHGGDFFDQNFVIERSDLVIAFNVFDHFEDWKSALKNLARFSNRYINFNSLLRVDGPTIIDPDLSFLYYGRGKNRLLWAVHNIYEIAAYCATEEIQASSISVYAYQKFNAERFSNLSLAASSVHALNPDNLLVGNVTVEIDPSRSMRKARRRPDLFIEIDGQVVCDSPWKT